MDTGKLALETYACSCQDGVEYGLCIKKVYQDKPGEPEYAGDDHELNIVTHDRWDEEPDNERDAYNKYGQQDLMQEFVNRWNVHHEQKDRIEKLERALLMLINISTDKKATKSDIIMIAEESRSVLLSKPDQPVV